jgi:hypothetical protein
MDIADILTGLTDCLCEQLAATLPVAQCCLVASDPIVPSCCNGFAWVRLLDTYPTKNGVTLDQTPDRCLPPVWAMRVELGVERCAPATCDALDNPCCDAERDSVMDLLSDFAAMQRALLCCLPNLPDGPRKDEVVLGPFRPQAPLGGCVRATMTATIRYLNHCAC